MTMYIDNNKKEYVPAVLEILQFEGEDIIAASGPAVKVQTRQKAQTVLDTMDDASPWSLSED